MPKLTPEEIERINANLPATSRLHAKMEALFVSHLMDRDDKCSELEEQVATLTAERDEWQHRHGLLQSCVDGCRDRLMAAIPAVTGKALQDVVTSVVAHVEQARELRTSLRATAASQVDHLQGEVLVAQDKCSSLMMEVDRLRADHKDAVELVEKLIHENRTLRGPVPPIEAGEIDPPAEIVHAAERIKVWMETNGFREWVLCGICDRRFASKVEELRAENGRQAATIAAMMTGVARVVTIHTGKGDNALFRDWMESQPFASGHEFRPDAWMLSGAQSPPPLRLEVGKTYVRRDGGRETIVGRTRFNDFPFHTESATYREDGTFGSGSEHPADLVAEAPSS